MGKYDYSTWEQNGHTAGAPDGPFVTCHKPDGSMDAGLAADVLKRLRATIGVQFVGDPTGIVAELVKVLREANELLQHVSVLAYDERVVSYMPYGMDERLKAWHTGHRVDGLETGLLARVRLEE